MAIIIVIKNKTHNPPIFISYNMKHFILYLFSLLALTPALKSQMTATELLDKSIEFHDPKDNWDKFKGTLNFTVERPDKANGKRTVEINNKDQEFSFWAEYEEGTLNYVVNQDKGSAKWNGSDTVPSDMAEKYRIKADRAVMYRNYYTYLYGMPMKLKDEGTIIDPKVAVTEFYGNTYHRIKVTYDPAVGKDIWYFYFNMETHALEAYKFYHDESKNDGEYILFKELKEIDKIKMPRVRAWYYNKDEKYLATDILVED